MAKDRRAGYVAAREQRGAHRERSGTKEPAGTYPGASTRMLGTRERIGHKELHRGNAREREGMPGAHRERHHSSGNGQVSEIG